ncbi:hypothetical protein V2J09_012113 [Rumex salicifolius]
MGGREDNRIFIGGIGWNTTERLLKDTFARYGKIIDCLVMTDRNTGRPRGFAFITFADRRSAEDALRDMHGRELDGRVISVNRADPKIASEEPDQGYDRFDDHFHGTRFSDRERFDSRDRYGARDRYENDRYPAIDDGFGDDRFGGRNAYPGYGRERSHERYRDVRGGGDRAYMSGGPTRYDQGIHRDRPGPYDHPRKSSRVKLEFVKQ